MKGLVVSRAVSNGLIENRRVRRQSRHGLFGAVTLKGAATEQIAGDVVQPKALAEFVQSGCCVHGDLANAQEAGLGGLRSTEKSLADQIADALDGDIGGS